MSKIKMMNKVVILLPHLKNYTIGLLVFLVMANNDEGHKNRYLQKDIRDITGLKPATLQLALKELENNNLLIRKNVGLGGNKNHAPEFILTL